MATTKAVRAAIITILTNDATLKTLLGGVDGRITRFMAASPEQERALTYYFYDAQPRSMRSRDDYVTFDAWFSVKAGAMTVAHDVLERVHALLTTPAFTAQGISAWVFRIRGPADAPTGRDNILRLQSEYRIHN